MSERRMNLEEARVFSKLQIDQTPAAKERLITEELSKFNYEQTKEVASVVSLDNTDIKVLDAAMKDLDTLKQKYPEAYDVLILKKESQQAIEAVLGPISTLRNLTNLKKLINIAIYKNNLKGMDGVKVAIRAVLNNTVFDPVSVSREREFNIDLKQEIESFFLSSILIQEQKRKYNL